MFAAHFSFQLRIYLGSFLKNNTGVCTILRNNIRKIYPDYKKVTHLPCLISQSTDGDWDDREDDFSDLEEIERLEVVVPPPPKDII